MKFLFQDFLTDKKIYNLNEAYYNRLVQKITGKERTPFYNTHYRNGEKFYDGNPIFNTLTNGRLLRIIQEEPEANKVYIRASLEHTPEEKIDELVITLELSQEVKPILEKLIKKWLAEKEDKESMSRFIEKELKSSSVYPEA